MPNPNPRCFFYFVATTIAQPLIGTQLTADIVPCAINTATGGKAGQSVAVVDSSIFQIGDFVNLIPQAGATTPAPEAQVRINDIPDPTHIVILNSAPHNNGDWVQLHWECAQVRVQEQKASLPTGDLFLGNDSTLDGSGDGAFENLALDITFLTPYRVNNSDSPSNYWVCASVGTPGYLASLWQE